MAGISKEGIGLLILRFQLPKRYVLAVENDVFFESIRQPGLTLQGGYCDSLFRGGDCLFEQTLPQKCVTKASVGVCVVRLQLESFLPIRDCFVDAAFCKKNATAVVIRIGVIRL